MLAARPQVTDPDFWWHVRNGNTLIATGHLIQVNPYAFMAVNHHWVMQEWLTEVWMAAAVAAGGRPAVVAVYWFVTLGMLLAIWARAKIIAPVHGATVGLGLVFAALCAYPILGPRPQMESYFLVAVTLLIAERQLRRGGLAALWLGPLFLIWTDLEAGFIIGLIFLAAILAVEAALVVSGRRTVQESRRLMVLGVGTLCAFGASLVNPNGATMLIYPFQTQFSSAQQALIAEWHSPVFSMPVLIPLLLFILSLAVLLVRDRQVPLRDVVVIGLALLVTLQSVRNSVVLLAVATPIWIVTADRSLRRLGSRGAWGRRRQPRLAVGLEAAYLVGLLAVIGWQVGIEATPALASTTYVNSFPVCAATWLRSAPPGIDIFNQYGDGGFLAYQVPRDKVYVFGDAALMGPTVLRSYAAIVDMSPGWLRTLNSSPSQLVVFERGSAFPDALQRQPSWTLVYRDPRVEAFERTSLLGTLHLPRTPSASWWRQRGLGRCVQ